MPSYITNFWMDVFQLAFFGTITCAIVLLIWGGIFYAAFQLYKAVRK